MISLASLGQSSAYLGSGSIKYRDDKAGYQKAWRLRNPVSDMLSQARYRAKKAGYPFDLTRDDVSIPVLCPVLKCEMVSGTPYAPSLDKIDPAKGYTKGNIQVISWKANLMKQDATQEELKRFAGWVLNG